jgi:hypothetical protein
MYVKTRINNINRVADGVSANDNFFWKFESSWADGGSSDFSSVLPSGEMIVCYLDLLKVIRLQHED